MALKRTQSRPVSHPTGPVRRWWRRSRKPKPNSAASEAENEIRGALLILIFNILVSICIPAGLSLIKPGFMTDQEQIMFGILAFCAVSVLELLIIVKKLALKNTAYLNIWEARQKADERIQEIRRMFHAIQEGSYGPNDLFLKVFNRQIEDLDHLLLEATTKKEIRIDQTMLQVTSELLSSAFSGRDEDIFRAVYYPSDNEFMFGLHGKRYFRQVYDLVSSGHIREVRRIIVYATKKEIEDVRTSLIIGFHVGTERYDCILIHAPDFDRIMRDFRLSHIARDFGIYGDRYLYKAYINVRDEIVGSYSKDASDITRFTDFFDACWVSPSAVRVTSDESTNTRAQSVLLNYVVEDATLGLTITHDPPSNASAPGE